MVIVFKESSSWKGLPGERILQYAYRAVPMPVVHRGALLIVVHCRRTVLLKNKCIRCSEFA